MISAMLDWLADTMIWTGLLIGLVLLVRRPVARRFGPEIAYALWALPLARLLLPPLTLPGALAPAVAPLPGAFAPALAVPVAAPLPSPLPVQAVVPSGATTAGSSHLLWILLGVWAAGAAGFIALRIITYRRMRRTLLAQAQPVGEVGRVRLVETPVIHGPVAFGVLDKVVALPVGFMAQPDRQARDFAIAHELSHHRAQDLLANMAAQLVLALHWCNPLAWFGWLAMRQDQEAACDARVMAGRGRAERACYAALIVGIATGQRTASPNGIPSSLACPMVGPKLGEAAIVQRLRSLTRAEASRRQRVVGRLLVGAGALALPLTASISYAAVQDATIVPNPSAPVAAAISQPRVPLPVQSIDPDIAHDEILVTGDGAAPVEEADAWAAFGARMEAFGREMAVHSAATEADTADIERKATALAAEVEQQFAPGGAMHATLMRQTEAATAIAMAEACATQASMPATGTATCDGTGSAAAAAASAHAEANLEANIMRSVARALSGARAAIASNMQLSAQERAEVLSELDAEIAELHAGN
ncbi:M56 family metallopeptidase [Croceibacterium ferulae]|uniref:M56 family metallopeptidase n=1 Tax=Croceibacterium ferulae TaxID=1854641 RepID=UPI000EB53D4F|nr:M56 family metallopeptidase [Croceibacterium ferulae]